MPKMKIESTFDKHSKRIVLDGELVALALAFSNGKWGVFTVDGGQQMTPRAFDSAKDVGKWVKAHHTL